MTLKTLSEKEQANFIRDTTWKQDLFLLDKGKMGYGYELWLKNNKQWDNPTSRFNYFNFQTEIQQNRLRNKVEERLLNPYPGKGERQKERIKEEKSKLKAVFEEQKGKTKQDKWINKQLSSDGKGTVKVKQANIKRLKQLSKERGRKIEPKELFTKQYSKSNWFIKWLLTYERDKKGVKDFSLYERRIINNVANTPDIPLSGKKSARNSGKSKISDKEFIEGLEKVKRSVKK